MVLIDYVYRIDEGTDVTQGVQIDKNGKESKHHERKEQAENKPATKVDVSTTRAVARSPPPHYATIQLRSFPVWTSS